MAKSVEDRGRGARPARRDEGAYCWYVTEEQRSRPGCIGREIDRLSHSRALGRGARALRPERGSHQPIVATAIAGGIANRAGLTSPLPNDARAGRRGAARIPLRAHELVSA